MCRDDRLNRQAKADTDRPVDGGADMSASLACAGNAERDARIVLQASFGDTFAACRAIAELSLVETTQRRRDAVLLRTPPPLRGERHRLDLHRVDPRQTTHAFLLEAHGRPIGLADPPLFLNLHPPRPPALPRALLRHKPTHHSR